MSFKCVDMTYSSGTPKIYQIGDQLPINFGLLPVDIDFEIYDGKNFISKLRPTLWKNIYVGRDEDLLLVPVLRILDKHFIDNGKMVYQRIKSFNGLC